MPEKQVQEQLQPDDKLTEESVNEWLALPDLRPLKLGVALLGLLDIAIIETKVHALEKAVVFLGHHTWDYINNFHEGLVALKNMGH